MKFAYYYVWRRGFLDGRAGFTYATLQAIYEYLIACKGLELERRRRGLPASWSCSGSLWGTRERVRERRIPAVET